MDYPGNGDFRGRREASIWQQLNRVLRVLLGLVLVLVIISFFVPQHRRLARERSDVEALRAQVETEKGILDRQTRENALLKSDPVYLENIARDKLDLMKPGETIIRMESLPAKVK